MRRKVYETKAKSQYAKPEFYWRGGDITKEKEFFYDQYQKELLKKNEADKEFEQLQQEYDAIRFDLHESDGYATALSGYIDGDSDLLIEENNLKEEIRKLEDELAKEMEELDSWQKYQNPSLLSSLQKERAYYLLEIQRGNKEITDFKDTKDEATHSLIKNTISPKYLQSWELDLRLEKAQKKGKYLRELVNRTKKDFDQLKPPKIHSNTIESREERSTLSNGIDLKIEIETVKEKIERHKTKYNFEIDSIINQIEYVNDRMKELKQEDLIIDTNALRDKYLDNDNSEQNKTSEEEEDQTENKEIKTPHKASIIRPKTRQSAKKKQRK